MKSFIINLFIVVVAHCFVATVEVEEQKRVQVNEMCVLVVTWNMDAFSIHQLQSWKHDRELLVLMDCVVGDGETYQKQSQRFPLSEPISTELFWPRQQGQPCQLRRCKFAVDSLQARVNPETVSWDEGGCGPVFESIVDVIAFERPARLSQSICVFILAFFQIMNAIMMCSKRKTHSCAGAEMDVKTDAKEPSICEAMVRTIHEPEQTKSLQLIVPKKRQNEDIDLFGDSAWGL